jgi:hypothetical protein
LSRNPPIPPLMNWFFSSLRQPERDGNDSCKARLILNSDYYFFFLEDVVPIFPYLTWGWMQIRKAPEFLVTSGIVVLYPDPDHRRKFLILHTARLLYI